jgi:hypothetical protein
MQTSEDHCLARTMMRALPRERGREQPAKKIPERPDETHENVSSHIFLPAGATVRCIAGMAAAAVDPSAMHAIM